MRRKTMDIIKIIKMVNTMNEESLCSPEMRMGWNVLLENILHANGVYAGYNNLTQDEVPTGQLPGIIRGTTRNDAGLSIDNQFPDDSRRHYFSHWALGGMSIE